MSDQMPETLDAPAITPGTRWDYMTVVLTHGFMGFHKGELNRAAFEHHLDELGRDGFELTWVFMDQKLHREKDGHVLIFKRTVQATT